MGLVPSIIAGTSIGALIGAGWANGMTGAEIRGHAERVLGDLREIAGRLWMTRRGNARPTGISLQADPRNIADAFLPDGFPDDFAELDIPLQVVATDYYSWDEVVFSSGPLRQAIAASFAIPGLFRPMRFGGRLYIDGGATDPLPVHHARTGADIVIAIDVNGAPSEPLVLEEPGPIDAGVVATQIMTSSIIRNAFAVSAPDVYVAVPVKAVRVLEFWRVREILAQAEADKDDFKRAVAERIDAFLAGKEYRARKSGGPRSTG